MQMATVSGNKDKVGVRKGRQTMTKMGNRKRYDEWQRKQVHKIFRKVRQKKVRTIKKQIPERNDCKKWWLKEYETSYKVRWNQLIPVEGEVCSQVDGSTSLCGSSSSLDFSPALLKTRNGVYIMAQLTTGLGLEWVCNIDSIQSAITILTHFKSTYKYDNIRDYSTHSFYTYLLRVGYSP